MRKYTTLALSLTVCMTSAVFAETTITDKSADRQQVGYSFGFLMGKSNANAVDDLDLDSFMTGFKQGFEGKESALNNEQMIKVLSQYKKKVEAEELSAFQKKANDNLKVGNDFLAKNATQSGIKTTTSGLQYEIIKQGSGKTASLNDNIKVHYEGRLLDGTIFDSSIARDEPVILPLKSVIKGWQEGIQLMPTGSTYRLFVPAKLAYGEIGSGDSIPPNSAVIYDIELLDIVSPS